jgi:hypothetical protein
VSMSSPESSVKKHFNFIFNFVDCLVQNNIEIIQYRYDGFLFGSWYLQIAYKSEFRRFIYDGRDSSLLVVDDMDKNFSTLDKSKKVFYKILTDDEQNNLLTIIKDYIK